MVQIAKTERQYMSTKSNKPTHRAYAVTPGRTKDDKGYWTEIGAAWPHKDGKGFRVSLRAIPAGNADLVIREIDADEATDQRGYA